MIDTHSMRELIAAFPNQIREALNLDVSSVRAFVSANNPVTEDVTFCGMGGSGIGGSLVRELFSGKVVQPLMTQQSYHIPMYRNSNSLLVISSYSGNTEEALSMMHDAGSAQVVCVASGGLLVKEASAKGYPVVMLPPGLPPRAAIAYSFIAQVLVLECFGLISNEFRSEAEEAAALITSARTEIQEMASGVAARIVGKLPVIYSDSHLETVALRLRQQLAENAKTLAWHHVIPEMNHNELVGWREEQKELAVVFLRSEYEHPRTSLRIEFTRELIKAKAGSVSELTAQGKSPLTQSLYLIHLVDWISQGVGEAAVVDTMEVQEIDQLKAFLSSH
jgi:glucose/mannose-6-phosphate isomerase